MADTDKEDRTEAPSARRLETAREEGRVAVSRELTMLVGLGAALTAMMMTGPAGVSRLVRDTRRLIEALPGIDVSAGGAAVVGKLAMLGAGLAAPPVLAASLSVVAITLLQTGFLLRPAALMPKPGRLNPLAGLKRLFGGDTAAETLKAVVKLVAFMLALVHGLRGLWPVLPGSVHWEAGRLADRSASLVLHAMLALLVVQVGIALLDTVWVRYRHLSGLRMSRQEMRDEHRQSDGDPHVKARIRQLRRQRARRRMMDAVPGATVVITNPTHYAVALVYDNDGKGAPRVVAKGVDEIAARIRERAIDARVPLVANPPLARALYTVPLDGEIPREHFQVVAGIIAYVWRLKRPAPGLPPLR